MIGFPGSSEISIADAIRQIPGTLVGGGADSTTEDNTNKKKSGVARFKRLVIKLACCAGMGDSERKFCETECVRIRFSPEWREWLNRADCRLRRSMSCFARSPDRKRSNQPRSSLPTCPSFATPEKHNHQKQKDFLASFRNLLMDLIDRVSLHPRSSGRLARPASLVAAAHFHP